MRKNKMPAGGKRQGSGRKSKYGEPTIIVPVRVPKSKKVPFKKETAKILKKWEIKPKN